MKKFIIHRILFGLRSVYFILAVIFLLAAVQDINGQPPPPPRPIKVTKTQDLSFGAFYQGGAGGTVTILSTGARSAGGSVVLFGIGGTCAIFEVRANPGTVMTFLKPVSTLTDGSGHTLSLQIGDTNPGSPFVTTNNWPIPTLVRIGGVLTIGAPLSNPPGNYNGTFDITFVQQ